MRLLLCTLLLAGCLDGGAGPDEIDNLGRLDEKRDETRVREVELELGPSEIKRFRIEATGFRASVAQDGQVLVKLSAKHLELEAESPVSAQPRLSVRGDGSLRNWTLRVENRGDDVLVARLTIEPLAAGAGAREIGVVSDIDKTVLPPETAAGLPDAYPGVAMLFSKLELRDGGSAGDVYYVTARAPDGIDGIDEWMKEQGLPAGPIDTGISTLPSISQPEKVRDISRIMDANPDQTFVLFGDTAHRDPEVYREILGSHPGQVAAVFIHKVNQTVSPDRVEGMRLVGSYVEAAATVFELGLLDEAAARQIMLAAQGQGLAISDDEIDALIDAHRP